MSTAQDEIVDALIECENDPVLFNDLFLDGKPFWEGQERVARSVVDYRTTVVYSGNMLGKDFLFARLALWWLCTRPDSLVFVTGPTQQQIGSIVWKEIRRAVVRNDADQILGACLPFDPHVTASVQASPQQVNLGGGWQALGFSTKSVERASGQHAGELLVLVIEGSGVEQEVWDAIESLGYDRLAVNGNPIRADGVFVDLIRQADKDKQDGIPPEKAVNAIRIRSTESPHAHLDKSPVGLADKTWIEAAARRYGKKSLWYLSHVEAEIPVASSDILIQGSWLDHLCGIKRTAVGPNHPIHLTRRISCDLGEGVGRDSSCVLVRDDWGILEADWGNAMGLSEAAAKYAEFVRKWNIPPGNMSYDKLGIGKNWPNHLAKHGLFDPAKGIAPRPYVGSGRPIDVHGFTNLRGESAWRMRERLDPLHIPDTRLPHKGQVEFTFAPGSYLPRLREEIKPLTYECYGTAIKLLDKEEWSEILGHSPDVCDTLIQSFSW